MVRGFKKLLQQVKYIFLVLIILNFMSCSNRGFYSDLINEENIKSYSEGIDVEYDSINKSFKRIVIGDLGLFNTCIHTKAIKKRLDKYLIRGCITTSGGLEPQKNCIDKYYIILTKRKDYKRYPLKENRFFPVDTLAEDSLPMEIIIDKKIKNNKNYYFILLNKKGNTLTSAISVKRYMNDLKFLIEDK